MGSIEQVLSHPLAVKVGWCLLHFLWQGLAAAAMLSILLGILRGRSSQARYVAGCLVLLLMAASPVATFLFVQPRPTTEPTPLAAKPEPAKKKVAADQSAELAAVLPAASERGFATTAAEGPSADPRRPIERRPSVVGPAVTATGQTQTQAPAVSVPSAPPAAAEPTPAAPLASSATWLDRLSARLGAWLPYEVLLWIVGVFVCSVWHLGGWVQVQRLRRRAEPLSLSDCDATWRLAAERLTKLFRLARPVRLLGSRAARLAGPIVVGVLKPAVLVPAALLSALTPSQIEAILAHEFAHVCRHDYLVNLFQAVIETALFYHPAVWWVSARIRAERENCCDDMAVAIVGDRKAYAAALADLGDIALAQQNSGGGIFARLAPGKRITPGARMNLLSRIRRILGRPATEGPRRATWLAGALILAGLLVAIPLACRPTGRLAPDRPAELAEAGRVHVLVQRLGAPFPDMTTEGTMQIVGQPTTRPTTFRMLDPKKQEAAWRERIGIASDLVDLGPPAVPAVVRMLEDPKAEHRELAADVLGRIGDRRAIDPLRRTMKQDVGATTQPGTDSFTARGDLAQECAIALARLGQADGVVYAMRSARRNPSTGSMMFVTPPPFLASQSWNYYDGEIEPLLAVLGRPAVDGIAECLVDPSVDIRYRAARLLGLMGDARAVEPLVQALHDRDPMGNVQDAAARSLGQIGDERAIDALLAAMGRETAVEALGLIGNRRVVPALGQVSGVNWPSGMAAVKAIDRLGGPDAIAALQSVLATYKKGGVYYEVVLAAAGALARRGKIENLEILEEASKGLSYDWNHGFQPAAVRELGAVPGERAEKILLEVLSTSRPNDEMIALARSDPRRPAGFEREMREAIATVNQTAQVLAALGLAKRGRQEGFDRMRDLDGANWLRVAEEFGNVNDPRAVSILLDFIKSREGQPTSSNRPPGVHYTTDEQATLEWARAKAVVSLARIGGPKAMPCVRKVFERENPGIRAWILMVLAEAGHKDAVDVIHHGLKDPDLSVRAAAVNALGKLLGREALAELREAGRDPYWTVRVTAEVAIHDIDSPKPSVRRTDPRAPVAGSPSTQAEARTPLPDDPALVDFTKRVEPIFDAVIERWPRRVYDERAEPLTPSEKAAVLARWDKVAAALPKDDVLRQHTADVIAHLLAKSDPARAAQVAEDGTWPLYPSSLYEQAGLKEQANASHARGLEASKREEAFREQFKRFTSTEANMNDWLKPQPAARRLAFLTTGPADPWVRQNNRGFSHFVASLPENVRLRRCMALYYQACVECGESSIDGELNIAEPILRLTAQAFPDRLGWTWRQVTYELRHPWGGMGLITGDYNTTGNGLRLAGDLLKIAPQAKAEMLAAAREQAGAHKEPWRRSRWLALAAYIEDDAPDCGPNWQAFIVDRLKGSPVQRRWALALQRTFGLGVAA